MSDKEKPRFHRSTIQLLIIGVLLLLIPLTIVLSAGSSCNANGSGCISNGEDKIINDAFPFPMIAGGLLIGYGMKRIADSKREDDDEEGSPPDPEQ